MHEFLISTYLFHLPDSSWVCIVKNSILLDFTVSRRISRSWCDSSVIIVLIFSHSDRNFDLLSWQLRGIYPTDFGCYILKWSVFSKFQTLLSTLYLCDVGLAFSFEGSFPLSYKSRTLASPFYMVALAIMEFECVCLIL